MPIIYGQDGFVSRVISIIGNPSDFSQQVQPGESWIEGDSAQPGVDRVVDSSLVVSAARPSYFHNFDKTTLSWILDISFVRTLARDRITKARDAEESDGFTAYGKVFDSDKRAIERITVGVQAAQAMGDSFTVEWTCKDNTTITLDRAQMEALPIFMAMAGDALHQKARTLKAQIDAATSMEEIDAIQW